MFLNPRYSYGSADHPFVYGKVIGILHAEVSYVGDIGRQGAEYLYYPLEILWVRWYDVVLPTSSDTELHQAKLLPIDGKGAHSFVDPSQVIRACHLIPKFSDGPRYDDGRGKSAIASDGSDWTTYLINRCATLLFHGSCKDANPRPRFVDRDMFMRYEWGLGVGHTYAYEDAEAANWKIVRAHVPARATVPTRLGQKRPVRSGEAEGSGAVEGTNGEPEEGGEHGDSDEGGVYGDEDEETEAATDEEDYDDWRNADEEAEKEYALFGSHF